MWFSPSLITSQSKLSLNSEANAADQWKDPFLVLPTPTTKAVKSTPKHRLVTLWCKLEKRSPANAWGRMRSVKFQACPTTCVMQTHGHRFSSRGGEECLKNWSTPQNGSRGGVKFGVTGGGEGGDKRKCSPQLRTTHKVLRLFCPIWALFSKTLSKMPDFFASEGGKKKNFLWM